MNEKLRNEAIETYRISCNHYDAKTGKCNCSTDEGKCDIKCQHLQRFMQNLEYKIHDSGIIINLREAVSELRSSFDDLHDDLEWAEMTESYPKASAVYRKIEYLEEIVNNL